MIYTQTAGWWMLLIFLAVLLDWFIGDPVWMPHPIVLMGIIIGRLTKWFNKGAAGWRRKAKGLFMWVLVIAITVALVLGVQYIAGQFHFFFLGAVNLWLLSTALAEKSLKQAVMDVAKALKDGDLAEARLRVGYLCGRDTTHLEKGEIIRATVETTAENTVDGVLAPLFYMVVGVITSFWVPAINPVVLAMVYKAVNTMDSMVGYKQAPYTDFGFFPAQIDDVFNYFIARQGSYFMMVAGFFLGFSPTEANRIYIRDRYNHKSPNSAHPESVVAGLLGVQLGGTNIYFGEVVEKPTIGDAKNELSYEDIGDAVGIMKASEIVMMAVVAICFALIIFLGGLG